MFQQRNRETASLFLLGDVVGLTTAFFAAWWFRFEAQIVPLAADKEVPDFERYLLLIPVALVIWPIVFYFHGLYRSRRGFSRIEDLFTQVVAHGLSMVMLAGLMTFYRPERAPGDPGPFTYSRVYLVLFVLSSVVLVGAVRLLLRSYLRRRRLKGHNIRRVLVAGAGEVGRDIARKIQRHRELGFEVAGFIDDDPGVRQSSFYGMPVLGAATDAAAIIEEHNIDQLMIALPMQAHKKISRLMETAEKEGLETRLVPNLLQYATLRAGLEDLDGTPVINLSQVPLEGWHSLAKRVMDVTLTGTAMIALLPFLPLIAALIWFEDRGPIFYRQERMGLDGRSFMMLKFRSMFVDAESASGPVWAIESDPRRTRIGSLLRRTSIDELPQLWNVFRGDMSIVGPRPERPTFVHEFKHKVPNYMLRHRVKSGITGWAQVHGWRGNTSIRKRIQYDIYYIQNWSLRLDIKILWMTVRQGLATNAY